MGERVLKVLGYFNPSRRISSAYREEYQHLQMDYIRKRVQMLCVGVLLFFVFSLGLLWQVLFESLGVGKLNTILIVSAAAILILLLTQHIRNLRNAKLLAGLLTALLLLVMIHWTGDQPELFDYPQFILVLFFSAFIIPWNVGNVIVIAIMHLVAWTLYYYTRDISLIFVPPSLLGNHPFINGLVYISFSAVLCIVIRYKENDVDVNRFLLMKELENKYDQIQRELDLASRVNMTLVPQSISTPKAEICVTYLPVSSVGGDYARCNFLDENRLFFFVSDVTGHGIPAALLVNRSFYFQ